MCTHCEMNIFTVTLARLTPSHCGHCCHCSHLLSLLSLLVVTVVTVVTSSFCGRCGTSASAMTLGQVNRHLDMLAAAQGLEEKKKVLMRFVVGLSAMQNKWICRIILKDMKLGLKADPILKFMHPDALDAFNASSSLKLVCGLLLDPSVRIAQRVSFFRENRELSEH